jgi:hypothetical protein
MIRLSARLDYRFCSSDIDPNETASKIELRSRLGQLEGQAA